jgi:O-acetyl-ADP-ribose deacetylase (regulator of RNase III)
MPSDRTSTITTTILVSTFFLKLAYKSVLERAVENKIQSVAFSLLSAATFRGAQTLETILAHGVTAIQEWSASYAKQTAEKGDTLLSQIVLRACTDIECESLRPACVKRVRFVDVVMVPED